MRRQTTLRPLGPGGGRRARAFVNERIVAVLRGTPLDRGVLVLLLPLLQLLCIYCSLLDQHHALHLSLSLSIYNTQHAYILL